MIGIFDSGLGGLTVLRALRDLLPKLDALYLADQAHVPYGDRNDDELCRLLAANVGFLDANGVEAIVVGCNTSCAIAAKHGWPPARAPIFGLIEPAVRAVAGARARTVGVVATSATVRAGSYGVAIRAAIPGVRVEEFAAPALVPLIESGRLDGPEMRAAIAAALARFSAPLDAIVYGCTHYPLADAAFAALLGERVVRIDPAQAQAAEVVRALRDRAGSSHGRTIFRTTGDAMLFREQIFALLGPYRNVERVGLHDAKDAEEDVDAEKRDGTAGDNLQQGVRP